MVIQESGLIPNQAENLGTNFFKSNLILSGSQSPGFVAFE